MIEPNDIAYIIFNEDKTATLGTHYYELNKDGQTVQRTRNKIIPREEAVALEKIMKKRDAEQAKIRKAAGAPPPEISKREPPRPMIAPNGRPVTMADIMKTKKKGQ